MRTRSFHMILIIVSLISGITISKILLEADVVETHTLKINMLIPRAPVVSDSTMVDQFVMTFGSMFSHTTPVLSGLRDYSMVINGNYAISGTSALDAAYYYCFFECACCCDSNTPCDSVFQDERITHELRPDVDTFRIDHVYYYSFAGADTAMVFEFEDCCYGDNSGSLNITIYEKADDPRYVHLDSASMYLREPGTGFVMRSSNGDCWKVHVDNSGALTTSSTACPD